MLLSQKQIEPFPLPSDKRGVNLCCQSYLSKKEEEKVHLFVFKNNKVTVLPHILLDLLYKYTRNPHFEINSYLIDCLFVCIFIFENEFLQYIAQVFLE